MSEKHERMRCAVCGRIVAARQPKLGDGSALLPYRHKALDGGRGSVCIGSFQDAIIAQAAPTEGENNG